ncbi:MAG TPA: phosphoribosyltransferase family protein [Anaeromyxobacteraceae bacterium]|nr:phosphoribosyltransferase family protein [Anaeromyxobacteraceae bacterium]
MPPRASKKPPRTRARAATARPRPKAATRARPAASRRRRSPRPLAEQPLGAGVADAFALKRLQVPPQRARPDAGVREVGWTEFGELARALAERISDEFGPEAIVGIVNGGVFLGGALAVPLHAEFHAVHVDRKAKLVTTEVPDVRGKRVLVVDDVTVSGKTMAAARAAVKKAGARDVRTASLVVRPNGSRPDFHAIETKDLVVFGWDYQLHGDTGAAGPTDPGEVGV